MLFARRCADRHGRTARIAPPFWPLVAFGLMIWGVAFCDGAENTGSTNLIGSTRDEAVALLGRPLSALQRGDTEVLMYADNVRLEIRNGEVVSHRSGNAAVLVKSDGTRYAPSDRGKVTRLAGPAAAEEAEEVEEASSAVAPASSSAGAASGAAEEEGDVEQEEDLDEPVASEDEDVESAGGYATSAADASTDSDMQLLKMADNYAEHGVLTDEEIKPEPSWVSAVSAIVGGLFHFGFTVIILRMAITFVDLPCYMPDVLKVSALYVVIREGVDGLGGLGGHWEWLRLFRAADVLSFFALCILLFQFKIALQGITALKIAVATKVATFILMILVGLALTFGLAAIA